MNRWLRSKGLGGIAFLVIAALVAGGLGWVTRVVLHLEQAQREARAQEEQYTRLRLAMWRLDSRVLPVLAREDSRPYNHFSALYAPSLALTLTATPQQPQPAWTACAPGTVLEPSPLLRVDLPDWVLLHFQSDAQSVWSSPQVLTDGLARQLAASNDQVPLENCTSERKQLLGELRQTLSFPLLVAEVRKRANVPPLNAPTLPESSPQVADNGKDWKPQQQDLPSTGQQSADQPQGQLANLQALNRMEYQKRGSIRDQTFNDVQSSKSPIVDPSALGNTDRNGADWLDKKNYKQEPTVVRVGAMVPLWLSCGGQERLIAARLVRVGQKEICQGIVLDWSLLQGLLVAEVSDLFPQARVLPVHDAQPPHPERTMTALPVELDPGPAPAVAAETWTPLRIGLALAWAAAGIALLAVGLGGWSLLDLSERRIRFVSAVTHELRTPLTTLRLYLDMLTGGMIQDEQQKADYLHTLNAETDRLNRLVGNVLDFSRLENQKPLLVKSAIAVADLLEQVRLTWQGRCQDAGKELVVDNEAGEVTVETDVDLVQQVLGNLVDNAIKYSKAADDCRIWLRARAAGDRWQLEVQDHGPGVPPAEQRSIFRPFRRGRGVEATAGGVGLGLALARRWSRLLGGRLFLAPHQAGGACFRLDLPR
jgi:signal transduction histidine kinase